MREVREGERKNKIVAIVKFELVLNDTKLHSTLHDTTIQYKAITQYTTRYYNTILQYNTKQLYNAVHRVLMNRTVAMAKNELTKRY